MKYPFDFQHDEDDFFHAIGLTNDDMYNTVCSTIMYELIAPAAIEHFLGVDAKRDDMTMSAVFQRGFNRLDGSPEMYHAYLIAFRDTYRKTKKRLSKASNFARKHDAEGRNVFKLQAKSIEEVMNHVKSIIEIEKTMKAIEFLKASNFDYDKFIDFTVHGKSWDELLPNVPFPGSSMMSQDEEDEDPEKYKDVDSLLRDIMSKEDEDNDE